MSASVTDKSPRPIIGITMGDPLGVGPEIIAAAWPQLPTDGGYRYVVIGAPAYLRRGVEVAGGDLQVAELDDLDQLTSPRTASIPCLSAGQALPEGLEFGQLDARAGRAAYQFVCHACDLAQADLLQAVVTGPLHKKAIEMAGVTFPGHTEILAARCRVNRFAMMLYVPPGQNVGGEIGLGVVHTTLHQSLKTAIEALTTDEIVRKCELAESFGRAALQGQGLDRRPRIAVAALNPHAGELGLFGREEIEIITPAVEAAQILGIDCQGPLPCDTLMARAVAGEFDLVVAMYHDQGHIALKLLGMHRAVNVTLGLPIVRTSVAHGTGFEIAGQGEAQCGSLLRAIDVARTLHMDVTTRCIST